MSRLHRARRRARFLAASGVIPPTLGALALSGTLRIGVATSGTIIGAWPGSSIAGNIPGITIDSIARTYAGTPTGSAQTIADGLIETLADAIGSPRSSPIVVAAASVALSITGTPPAATVGSAYSFTPTVAGGAGTRSLSLTGSLPAGLSLNTATGEIAGTPTAAGTASGLDITVTDDSGSASLGAFSITVAAAASAGGQLDFSDPNNSGLI